MVFLSIIQISPDENRNLKLSSPHHALVRMLCRNPPLMVYFLNAIIIPNMGKNEKSRYQTAVGNASMVNSVSSLFHFRFFPGFFFKSAIKYASFFFFIVLFHI